LRRLDVTDVHKSYGDHPAVTGISLRADVGEIVAVLGRNGAGKTTLIGMMAGRHQPDHGSVTIDGLDLATDRREAALRIGYVPQETGLYEFLPGRDTLAFFGELAGLRGAVLRDRIDWAVDLFHLGEFVSRPCENLSGGERRRIHTAAGILHRPDLLLLDEPTVGADLQSRADILAAVRSLAASGTTVIYTTHYLPEVEELQARIALIESGRIIAEGDQDDLIRAHGTPWVDLTFDGPAPVPKRPSALIQTSGDHIMVRSANAPVLAARLLARLGPETDRLVSMETHQADLDAVFLALTGRDINAEEGP
jgi:ABC-2 type transport system ATP-binding protein